MITGRQLINQLLEVKDLDMPVVACDLQDNTHDDRFVEKVCIRGAGIPIGGHKMKIEETISYIALMIGEEVTP